MDPLYQALAGLGTLFLLVGLAAAAYASFKGAADKTTVEAQGRLLETRGAEIADLTRRVAHLEHELELSRTREGELLLAVAQVRGIDTLQATASAIKSDTAAIRLKVGAA